MCTEVSGLFAALHDSKVAVLVNPCLDAEQTTTLYYIADANYYGAVGHGDSRIPGK